jgi:predicted ATPase
LAHRARTLWLLGYPEAALADAEQALKDAREVGHAATLMYALTNASYTQIHCGQHALANALINEAIALADEKNALFWKTIGTLMRGCLFAVADKALDAVQTIATGLPAYRSTGSTVIIPFYLSYQARAHAQLGNFDYAWCCVSEAMDATETTKERWCEAEVNRISGEIALLQPEPSGAKAEAYFKRSLSLAGKQQAKSWELRGAMSMARLWRNQGKTQQARELLAPIYGWFTEGFDTLDLKEAKAFLEELL